MVKTLLHKSLPVLIIALFCLVVFMLRCTGVVGESTGLNIEANMATPQYGAVYD